MANKKLYDLSVKTGRYEKNGEEKAVWENIGGLYEKDGGGQFLTLKRTFNPAGVPMDGHASDIIFVALTQTRR